MRQRKWARRFFVLGIWIFVGLYFSIQVYLQQAYENQGISIGRALYNGLVFWILWAVFSPLIIWLARNFRVTREQWLDSLLFHIPTGVIFSLLHLALTRPRIDAAPLARIRSQVLAIIASEASSPDNVAGQAWFSMMFPGHPYARLTKGTAKTLNAITGTDLRNFAKRRFGRDQLRIAVVGDISKTDLARLLDQTFGDLPAHAASPALPEASPPGPGGIAVMGRDLDQSIVVFGETGIKRGDPDFYAAAFDLWHAGKHREAFDMFGRMLAFNSIPGASSNYLLVLRGIFKESTKQRTAAGGGGGRAGRGANGPLDEASKKAVRDAWDEFMKPYLRG